MWEASSGVTALAFHHTDLYSPTEHATQVLHTIDRAPIIQAPLP